MKVHLISSVLFRLGLAIVVLLLSACAKPEASNCLPASEIGSYYDPSKGTVNLHYDKMPCEAPILIGESLSSAIVVLNDVGRTIQRVNGDGSLAWTYRGSLDRFLLDLRLVNGDIQFIERFDLVRVDAVSGIEKHRETIGEFWCYDGEVACKADGVLILATGVTVPATYPRAAAVAGGVLFVADTFGHKVDAYDASTAALLWTVDSYFPNSIQVENGRIVVAEEHANRIASIDIATQAKSLIVGCSKDVFIDETATVAQIQARERAGAIGDSEGRSICAGEMYSPNDGRIQADGSLLVSDTDDHRVVQYRADGSTIREIRNLNNPVRAIILGQ